MTKESTAPAASDVLPPLSFKDFLEGVPPSEQRDVVQLTKVTRTGAIIRFEVRTPEISLYCSSSECSGIRFFRFVSGARTSDNIDSLRTYLVYVCSNCQKTHKQFALQFSFGDSGDGTAYKFGERPAFGPPTPPRLLKLLGDQRDIFLRGRRCENQGLGIGAFVYYRRVVEHQKTRLLEEIVKAAKLLGAPDGQIRTLELARDETQFSKALASVKDAVPQALLISGHNPLSLLHSALSGGVHDHSDQECLALAQDIRIVLVDLAERLSQVLKDDAEIKGAVSRLLNRKAATSK